MSYLLLKHIHIGCVILSGLGFLTRSFWMLKDSRLLASIWARRLPHVVDSVLLGAAIGMLSLLDFSLLKAPWLIGKLLGLLLYIVMGAIALKRGRTRQARIKALVFALLSYLAIISLAILKPGGV